MPAAGLAAVAIGSAVVGGVAQNRAAKKAANAQTKASREAIAAQQDSEDRAIALQRPFFNAGYAATAALLDLTGVDRTRTGMASGDGAAAVPGSPEDLSSYAKFDYTKDPGYQFRMDEGVRALDRSAASRGSLNSGGQLRKVTRYGQDYASNEYQRVYDRIAQIAGFGGRSSSEASSVIVNTGQGVSGALVNAGEARASGFVAQGNAFSNALNQGSKAFGFFGNQGGGSNSSDVFNRSIAISNAVNG